MSIQDDVQYQMRRSLMRLRRDLEEYRIEEEGLRQDCERVARQIMDLQRTAHARGINLDPR